MSRIMSELDQNDALAAEYVLGTLDSHERALARTLLTDEAFAAKVRRWERRLGELHLMVEPVEPDAKIWPRIKGRMYEPEATTRLPEPQNLEPPPVPAETPAAAPPSLEAIEAVISDAAMTLNAEASPAQKSEQAPERPPDAAAAAASEPIPAPMEEVAPMPASEPAPALAPEPSSEEAALPPPLEASSEATLTPPSEPSSEPTVTSSLEPSAEATVPPSSEPSSQAAASAPSEPPSEPVLPPSIPSAETTVTEISETTVVHIAGAPPEPSAVEPPIALPPAPSIPAPAPPPPVVAPAPALEERLVAPVEPQRAVMRVQRRLRRWRAFGLLLTLVVAALAALVAAWRFAPDRVPPPLQPLALMRHFGVTPPTSPQLPRRPLPPGSQYDE
jgi:anti-sigma-K factor RskA